MSFPRYPVYKPSSVEWLGEVPEHWEEKPLKTVTSINDEVLPESVNTDHEIEYVDISSVSLAKGIERTEAMSFGDAPSRARRIPRDGDVLVSTVRTYLKAIAPVISPPSNLVTSTGFAVIRPKPGIHPGYLKYALQEEHFIQQVISRSTGVSYPAINASDIARITLSLPSQFEQLAIASFLDRETAKIDALIAEQQRLIELLQEKRQSVISHAVTKGLNPNAPMKDSGVEWLGEVPEHWDIKRIKHLSKAISKGTTPSTIGAEFTPSGIRFIKAENITSTGVEPLPEFFISDETNQELSRSILFGGEVLVVIAGATTGKSAVIPKEICPANTNQAVCFIRTKCAIASSFINHWLSQKSVQNHIAIGSVQSAQPNLSMEDLGNIPIALPPLEEMRQITSLCDLRRADAEVSAAESSKLVELLKERRSALISAAVTGQIDVRGLAEAEEEA